MAAVKHGLGALTEKEKETLRLIVRGHDAKSVARSLGLSVHTINERLRDARRKLAVSSSREAARLLLEAEGGEVVPPVHDFRGDTVFGEATPPVPGDPESAPAPGAGRFLRLPHAAIGVAVMFLALAVLVLAAAPQLTATSPATAAAEAPKPAVIEAARQFLTLVDQSRWDNSYCLTDTAFQKLNTSQVWAAVSEKVRVPLGAAVSRTFASEEELPAPPAGYEVVKFRTDFANKAGAVETVSLELENGTWRVAGVIIS